MKKEQKGPVIITHIHYCKRFEISVDSNNVFWIVLPLSEV